jgi:hypothetical protein
MTGLPVIREIIARIIAIIIIHFAMVHATLPINPRITKITAIMMNSIPRINIESIIFLQYRLNLSY